MTTGAKEENRAQGKARTTRLGYSQQGESNAAMRLILPLPFGLADMV